MSTLSHTVHVLEEQFSSSGISRLHGKHHNHSRSPSSSCSSHKVRTSHKVHSTPSNSLPFRVVWGTPRICSSQVIWKALAICALLPSSIHAYCCQRIIPPERFGRFTFYVVVYHHGPY